MDATNTETLKIEFNSMAKILERLDKTTYLINFYRVEKNIVGMLDALVDYYKEISPDLDSDELKIWDEIKAMKRKVNYPMNWSRNSLIAQLDEIDIKLRKYAKNHGYLTKNLKKLSEAVLNM